MDNMIFCRLVQRLLEGPGQRRSLGFLPLFEKIFKLVDQRFDMNLHPFVGNGVFFTFAQILDSGMLVRHISVEII